MWFTVNLSILKNPVTTLDLPGRRSERFARNAAKLLEKQKMANEQETALEAAEKKVEEERRIWNAAIKKQRKMSEQSRVTILLGHIFF